MDASVIVKLALESEAHADTARRLVRDSVAAGMRLIAPPIFHAEVDSVIRKCICTGRLAAEDATLAYRVLDLAPVEVVWHPELRRRARQLADRFNLRTVYDATYAALAELRRCEFWTADKAFCEAVSPELRFVRFLGDYPG